METHKVVVRVESKVDARIDGVESKVDGVESKVDGVESKLDQVLAMLKHMTEQGQESYGVNDVSSS